ncbi:hypothetical protein [Roseateles violae]|uniref:Uncharacterized protein n=1 Tax=Roseateles violae TaxID=3058042 RepID=A0ABT8DWS2_9BURK|nr:hypothetical protein [Pelomonas sp. PFR6]MDN3920701.1 hypothetical protein [Pelomonas sp. PFR6]
MPQILHVGHRSPWVSAIAWLLMAFGLAGLAFLGYLASFAAAGHDALSLLTLAELAIASLLALTSGQGLLRRYEWGRRLSVALLGLLMLALPALPWLTDSSLGLAILSLAISAALIWPLRQLSSLDVRQEFA